MTPSISSSPQSLEEKSRGLGWIKKLGSRPLVFVLILSLAVLLIGSSAVFLLPGKLHTAQAAQPQPIGADEDIARFTKALEEQGFVVQKSNTEKGEGLVRFDIAKACCDPTFRTSCECNNAGALYKPLAIPDAPDQTGIDAGKYVFHLGINEAIIIVGQTPPRMSYFSFQPFVFFRYSEKQKGFLELFTPLGDTLNNLTIRTSGPPSDPFDKDMIIVLTADRGIDQKVGAAARKAGYPPSILNTLVMPSAVAHMGLEMRDDQFNFLHRVFRAEDPEAVKAYMDKPQVALRVTLPDANIDPFPVQPLRVRGTGLTEMDLMPAVEELRSVILAQYGGEGMQVMEFTTEVWLSDGYDGQQREITQWGPTRDALYLRTAEIFELGAEDFVIVYGTNHEVTGKATYANAAIYADKDSDGRELLLGLVSEQSGAFVGSASDYLPGHPAKDFLYVWKFALNCNGDPHCTEVYWDCERLDGLPSPMMFMGFRAYLEPSTAVGPSFTEVIYDQAIKFSPVP